MNSLHSAGCRDAIPYKLNRPAHPHGYILRLRIPNLRSIVPISDLRPSLYSLTGKKQKKILTAYAIRLCLTSVIFTSSLLTITYYLPKISDSVFSEE